MTASQEYPIYNYNKMHRKSGLFESKCLSGKSTTSDFQEDWRLYILKALSLVSHRENSGRRTHLKMHKGIFGD